MIKVVIPYANQDQQTVCWQGWGTSLAWWANAVGKCPSVRQQLCTLLFHQSPARGLGMNIVRYNIGGACQNHTAEYRTGAAVPCVRRTDGSYDWAADDAQTAVLLEAVKLGADTVEAFANSPPWFWTVSGSSRGHRRPYCNNLKNQHIGEFADFCADVLEHFRQVHSVHMQSLSPFNEPASPAWCIKLNNRQEGCYFSTGRMHKVLGALSHHPKLQATQLVAFEQFCCHDTWSDLRRLPKELWPAVHRVNTHTYTSKHFFKHPLKLLLLWQDNSVLLRKLLRRQLQQHQNVPLWVSEFGTGRGALALAKQVLKDLATLRPTAWIYWQAVEGVGSNWGLLEVPLDTYAAAGAADSSTSAAGAAASSTAAAVPEIDEQSVPIVGIDGGSVPITAALQNSSGCRTGGVPVSAEKPDSSSNHDPPPQITVHQNYFVLQFLMQCIPKGCSYMPLKALGKHGVLAFHTHRHAVLVYLNASRQKARKLSIYAQQWVGAAEGADNAATATAAAVDAVPKARPPPAAAAAAMQEPSSHSVLATISLLDVASLSSADYTEALLTGVNSTVNRARSDTRLRPEQWPLVIDVPKSTLCRIDVIL